jgi:acyl-ACP thioesterase
MRIKMERYPVWDEVIQIETWPSGLNKLFAIRDFRVTDSAGKEMGVASTAWLVLNMETRRPMRPFSGLEELRTSIDRVFEFPLEKIGLPDTMDKLENRIAAYSDLDVVGHVNSVKYMGWCVDAADPELVKGKEIRDLEINYLNESVWGDNIEIFGSSSRENDSIFSARRVRDGKEIIRAKIAWS